MILFKKNETPGFTLVEVLVVIMIIGILATIATLMINVTRPASRDVKRISSVKQVQTALELYFADEGKYPPTDEVIPGQPLVNPNTGITYMSEVPLNPQPADGECPEGFEFNYAQIDGGSNYNFEYCLSKNVDWVPGGENIADHITISTPFICGLPIEYGGQEYNTIAINTLNGSKCWLKENLNIGNMLNDILDVPADNNIIEKWCYNNDSANCNTYGGFYTWQEAMQRHDCPDTLCSLPAQNQGICPPGWHIPTKTDWHDIEMAYSNPQNETNCDIDRTETSPCNIPSPNPQIYSCKPAPLSLKGNNSASGLNFLPAGLRYINTVDESCTVAPDGSGDPACLPHYIGMGIYYFQWLADQNIDKPINAYNVSLNQNECVALSSTIQYAQGLPVRCVKN